VTSASERKALVARLRAFDRGLRKLHMGDEAAAADLIEERYESTLPARARADALDEAENAIEEAFDRLAERRDKGSDDMDGDEVVEFLRVELGVRHAQGAHHPAPGFASVVSALPE